MPRTYTVNACRIVTIAGSVDLAAGSGSCQVAYSRGSVDADGAYTPLAGEAAHTLSLPVGAGGLMAAAQEVVRAIAQTEGLDPAQGDTIQ